jgi:hypothetical protein
MSRYVTTIFRSEKETFREIPFGEDPADEFVGVVKGSVGDEGVNHDHYLYGWRKEDPSPPSAGGRGAGSRDRT